MSTYRERQYERGFAREGLAAWNWAREHHANDHTGDPRPHRDGCQCGHCPDPTDRQEATTTVTKDSEA